MVGEPVVIAEPSFLEGESSPAVLERFVSQSRNVRAVSEANRGDSFGKLGPQEFAFDTAL
jgi:hypothetical protein